MRCGFYFGVFVTNCHFFMSQIGIGSREIFLRIYRFVICGMCVCNVCDLSDVAGVNKAGTRRSVWTFKSALSSS